MNTALSTQQDNAKIMENVLVGGDLSKLSTEQRLSYYTKVCDSIGLNPLTKPFEYITLNDKLTLYAKRDCTDQLRSVHRVSVVITDRQKIDNVYIVTAKATTADGRTDESTGAVTLEKENGSWESSSSGKKYFKKDGTTTPLKGDELANAMMKAETKAKRRATLSLCGLGLLDETEVESIPNAFVGEQVIDQPAYKPTDPVRPYKQEYVIPAPIKVDGTLDFDTFAAELEAAVSCAGTVNHVSMLNRSNAKTLKQMQAERPDLFDSIGKTFREMSQSLA